MRPLFRSLAAALAVGVAALGVTALAPSSAVAATGTSKVSILHAVPGLNVDVYANGKKLLTDFKPGTLAGPLTLPAGSYDLAVRKTGASATSTPAIKADNVTVPAGVNVTVVAHLSATGTPVLTPYVNNISKLAPGKARITVRHDAAAPAVDVRAGGTPVFKSLTNPGEATAVIGAGTIKADVVLAGTSTVAIGPASLTLAEGTNTIVYAWGSAKDKNLKLAVQTITGLHSAPMGVPSGSGGLLTNALPMPLVALTLGGLALLLFGAAGARSSGGLRARRISVRS